MLYWLARKYGMNITNIPMIGTHVTKERILWAEQKFERHGVWVVAVCRMIAGVRGAMVIAAGVLRFNFAKFIIADGAAAVVSGGVFVYLGYFAGIVFGSIDEMRAKIKDYEGYVVLGFVVVVILIGLYVWWRRKRHTTLSEVAVDKVEQVAHRRIAGQAEK
jgi:membrane protein DedA with SNARE-associated domain